MKYIIYILFGLLLGCNADNNSTDSQTEKTSRKSTKKSNTQNEATKVDAANDTLAFNFDTTLTNGPKIKYWLENKYLIKGNKNKFQIDIEGVDSDEITLATILKQSSISKGQTKGEFVLDVNQKADEVVIAIHLTDSVSYQKYLLTELTIETRN